MSGFKAVFSAVVLIVAVGFPVYLVSQQTPQGPGAIAGGAAVIETAKKLQESPLDRELQEKGRQEMLVNVRDIGASACDEEAPWGPWADSDYKYSSELMAVYTLSNAAFVLTNAGRSNPKTAHMAGLEGTIQAYQAIVAVEPTARWKKMEQLISKRDRGTLLKKSAKFCATPIPLKNLAAVAWAAQESVQGRFKSGWLEGFTMSPTEHEIIQADRPFTVHDVKGLVFDGSGAEMDDVVVEIRDANGRIRGTKTNPKGAFKFGGLPEGTYRFKVTMGGFKSVVGEIVVSRNARKSDIIKIEMWPGA